MNKGKYYGHVAGVIFLLFVVILVSVILETWYAVGGFILGVIFTVNLFEAADMEEKQKK